MIDIQNIQNNNWESTRICIIGAGKSGIAAAKLGKHLGAEIFISDIKDSKMEEPSSLQATLGSNKSK